MALLVALHLRAQGVFDTYRSLAGHATSRVNRKLFYFLGTRVLLPAGWRWFAACRQHAGEDTSLAYLAQSTFTRVQRALEARGAVHRALNQPHHDDTAGLKAVACSDPALAQSLALETWNATVVRLLSQLRNSVHAEAPVPPDAPAAP